MDRTVDSPAKREDRWLGKRHCTRLGCATAAGRLRLLGRWKVLLTKTAAPTPSSRARTHTHTHISAARPRLVIELLTAPVGSSHDQCPERHDGRAVRATPRSAAVPTRVATPVPLACPTLGRVGDGGRRRSTTPVGGRRALQCPSRLRPPRRLSRPPRRGTFTGRIARVDISAPAGWLSVPGPRPGPWSGAAPAAPGARRTPARLQGPGDTLDAPEAPMDSRQIDEARVQSACQELRV